MNDQKQSLKIFVNNETSKNQKVIICQKGENNSSNNQYHLYVWKTTQLAQNAQWSVDFPIIFQVAGVAFDSQGDYRTTNKENVQKGKGWKIVQSDHEAPLSLESFDNPDLGEGVILVRNDSFSKKSAALFKQNKMMMSLELAPNDDIAVCSRVRYTHEN